MINVYEAIGVIFVWEAIFFIARHILYPLTDKLIDKLLIMIKRKTEKV